MKFSDFDQKIIDENVDFTVKEITKICEEIGPRESGSKEAVAAEAELEKMLRNFSSEVHYEGYKMAPKAFLHFTKSVSDVIIPSLAAATALHYSGKGGKVFPDALVFGTTAAGLTITAEEFLFYKRFCDILYKKTDGHTLVATRKATEETKKRIVIVGHIDSEYEWRHTYYGKGKGMGPIMGGTIVSAIASCVMSVLNLVGTAGKLSDKSFFKLVNKLSYPVYLFTIPNMITLHSFINYNVISPGANDNLTGTLAAFCALKMLDEAGIEFKHTDVVCCINDGEEAGLRGAKQYAEDHLHEFTEEGVETHILAVDTLTDREYMNIYNRDLTGQVRHDPKWSQFVMDSAHDAGITDPKFANVYFGASDAAAFTQAGISATCLAAMDPGPADYYHNRKDKPDRLNPVAIRDGYKIILSTILNFAGDDDVVLSKKDKEDK